MHIDVNNAFLSWTAVDLLKKGYTVDIRNIEAVIGGDETKRHGIVLAKSPMAKKKGVKTADTIREAKRKCRNLKVFSPNHDLYHKESKKLFDLISNYTPDIEILSVDECFIDYTKVKKMYGDPIDFAYKLRNEINIKLGITVNIGIANNKLCAKMASDFEKPNKVHTLFMNEVEEKMYPLPIEELYGVGRSSSKKLRELGINKIEDLANADYTLLYKYFKNQTKKLIDSAKGISDSIITLKNRDVSISNSTTLPYNLNDIEDINKVILSLVENVCITLRKKRKYASVVGVSLKDKFLKTKSHQRKLLNATDNTDEIYNVCKVLACELYNDESIRLVGVSLSKLTDYSNYQISLFEDVNDKQKDSNLDRVVDDLKQLYGSKIINKASIINSSIHKK